MSQKRKSGARRRSSESSTPPPAAEAARREPDRRRRREPDRRRRRDATRQCARALAGGTVVALVAAAVAGFLRIWVWILGLEPLAIGVVIGEAAAVPSSARHLRPPRWSYTYVFLLGCLAYLLVHAVFWMASGGLTEPGSLIAFLREAPSGAAAPLLHSADPTGDLSAAVAGTSALKYWLWAGEGLLTGLAATIAYRGGSVRRLKS